MLFKPETISLSTAAAADLPALKNLAVRGLDPMFERERGLFCNRLVRTEAGFTQEGLSPRYTIMTLLGLREFERNGGESQFNIVTIANQLLRETQWIQCAGDLGLTIWLAAVFAPQDLGKFLTAWDVNAALSKYRDARHGRTTELAWFLAGLSHAGLASPENAKELKGLAAETYRCLEKNQAVNGLFGHMCKSSSLAGKLRGRIGSFADQIYPIYAMAKCAVAFGIEEALSRALACADAICGRQGTLGQWWWLYDSASGRVSSRYPVYSVHQQGMAPMGLFAVEDSGGRSFRDEIYKGLGWIYGNNELAADMRDLEHNLIWRCILPESKQVKYRETILSLVRSPNLDSPVGPLKILYEDRPYELGWLLFAFARFDSPEAPLLPKTSVNSRS